MEALPLAGIRVVDLTIIWGGPYATMFLADWGAEVIRVESISHWPVNTRGQMPHPPQEFVDGLVPWAGGYPNREPGDRPWNRHPWFNCHARNKLSMTVDLMRPDGLAILRRLIEVSDVLIENNATGVMEKLGITYEQLKEWKPDIIMVRMPAYGNWGPYGHVRAMGMHLEAVVGHYWLRGYHDADPSMTPNGVHADAVAGVHAAGAVMMALFHRRRTGCGQLVEVALGECVMPQLGQAMMDQILNGRVQNSRGNRDTSAAPCGCYRCRGEDRWVNITVASDEQWAGFCSALGHPHWTKDQRFADVLSRHNYEDELDRYVEAWTLEMDHYEVMKLLQMHGVPAGAVIDQREAFEDPHIRERGFFQELTHPEAGTHLYPGIMWRASETPNSIRRAACRLGEDNEYVYKRVLGVSDEEYARLEKAGHIGMDFIPEIT